MEMPSLSPYVSNSCCVVTACLPCPGVKNKVRQLVGGSRCDACAREYNTPTCLQHHLNHSHSCYARLLMVGEIYLRRLLPREEQF